MTLLPTHISKNWPQSSSLHPIPIRLQLDWLWNLARQEYLDCNPEFGFEEGLNATAIAVKILFLLFYIKKRTAYNDFY